MCRVVCTRRTGIQFIDILPLRFSVFDAKSYISGNACFGSQCPQVTPSRFPSIPICLFAERFRYRPTLDAASRSAKIKYHVPLPLYGGRTALGRLNVGGEGSLTVIPFCSDTAFVPNRWSSYPAKAASRALRPWMIPCSSL